MALNQSISKQTIHLDYFDFNSVAKLKLTKWATKAVRSYSIRITNWLETIRENKIVQIENPSRNDEMIAEWKQPETEIEPKGNEKTMFK